MSITLSGKGSAPGSRLTTSAGLMPRAEEEQRHVADDLGAGRDLDDVAEELVHLGVGAGDFRPAVAEAHAGGLLLEVGVLAAGHLVEVDLGGAVFGAVSNGA
jgi:hypothetical protein